MDELVQIKMEGRMKELKKATIFAVALASICAAQAAPGTPGQVLTAVMPITSEVSGYQAWKLGTIAVPQHDWDKTNRRFEATAEFRKGIYGGGFTLRTVMMESYQQALQLEANFFSPNPIKAVHVPGETVPGFDIGDRCTLWFAEDFSDNGPTIQRAIPQAIVMVKGKVVTFMTFQNHGYEGNAYDPEVAKSVLSGIADRVGAVGLGGKSAGGYRLSLTRDLAARANSFLSHPRYKED